MLKQEKKNTIHVKTGDRVFVIAGKDKGKIGTVKKVILSTGRVIVEGVNIITKATKANPMLGIQGGHVKKEASIHSSNVMICCPKTEKPTRIRHEVLENGKKTRVCKISGEQLDA
ncbi:MAG: 50S ribosomal protein L24 [Candidatus Gastranaerophilaceae bacterium]|jgi:large subunit ribosomal protein L24